LTIEQAIDLSFERLLALAAAVRRKRANEHLILVQGIAAGFGNASAFKRVQEQLINQTK
jgi:hypothetical protein